MPVFNALIKTVASPWYNAVHILRRINDRLRYNDTTIAEKFRKQGAKIGANCYFQIRHLAAEPYLIEIGNSVSIASGVQLITHDGASVVFRDEFPYLRYFGKIVIEDNCFIGSGAVITAGVRIGRNTIIGTKSVIISDVKPGSIMIGNPAIRVSTVEKYKERCLREWDRQGLTKFEPLFKGKSKDEVQSIFVSKAFRRLLKEHLLSVDFSQKGSGMASRERAPEQAVGNAQKSNGNEAGQEQSKS